MKRLGPGALILLALLLSAASAMALTILFALSIPVSVTQIIVATLGVYCLFLIGLAKPPVGRVSGWLLTGAVTVSVLVAGAYWGALNGPGALAMLGWTWLVRCALLHRNLVAMLGDGLLLTAGVAAAVWTFQAGGSITIALWSFFLVQALMPWLPSGDHKRAEHHQSTQSRFDQANQRAEQALRRLYARPHR